MKKFVSSLFCALALVVGGLTFITTPASAATIVNHAQPGVWYDAVWHGCWLKAQFGNYYVPYAKMSVVSSDPHDTCSMDSYVNIIYVDANGQGHDSSSCQFNSPDNPNIPGCAWAYGAGYGGANAKQYIVSGGTAIGMNVEVCMTNVSEGCTRVVFSAF